MTKPSHTIAGLITGYALSEMLGWPQYHVLAFVAGAIAPDYDIKLFGSARSNSPFSHRGIFHSIALWITATLIWHAIFVSVCCNVKIIAFIMRSFFAGGFLHVMLDMFSKTGVPLLFSKKTRIAFKAYSTGGVSEMLFLCCYLTLLAAAVGKHLHFTAFPLRNFF